MLCLSVTNVPSFEPLLVSADPVSLLQTASRLCGLSLGADVAGLGTDSPRGREFNNADAQRLLSALRAATQALDATLDASGNAADGKNYFNQVEELRAAASWLDAALETHSPIVLEV